MGPVHPQSLDLLSLLSGPEGPGDLVAQVGLAPQVVQCLGHHHHKHKNQSPLEEKKRQH